MESAKQSSSAVFEVYLRLRPRGTSGSEQFIHLDEPTSACKTSITIKPPENDHRKRPVEKFCFTRVFDENSSQLDVFKDTNILPLVEGVLAPDGRTGRDGLLATLGVTGSGKSHTILGTRTQRGLTQMTLDVLFKSTRGRLAPPHMVLHDIAAADVTGANFACASAFLDHVYGVADGRATSRAQTPMTETQSNAIYPPSTPSHTTPANRRHRPVPSSLPHAPRLDVAAAADKWAEYSIVVSMYEIYNDQIFDLLNDNASNCTTRTQGRELRRRPLLFKSTEYSPDRKVVAGLRKIVCGSLEEAFLVLETGLMERTVAGTGSNATSSRSHGFFCVEVKKRVANGVRSTWRGSTLTIVDMAGTERARTAKTAGTTLAEAGKINESLMWLGQYMQFHFDKNPPPSPNLSNNETTTSSCHMPPPSLPHSSSTQTNSKLQQAIRRCKLTELLFSNSSNPQNQTSQKAIMIVTADPQGDYNATSQMLRYSALAREVTQPRIPSVSSIVGWNNKEGSSTISSRPTTSEGDHSALTTAIIKLEQELKAERELRLAAELRIDEVEMEVRQDCWDQFDLRLQAERNRWEDAFDDAMEAQEKHVDAKVGIVSRGLASFQIHEDDPVSSDASQVDRQIRVEELERENELLKEEVRTLKNRLEVDRTPSKRFTVLKPVNNWQDRENSALGTGYKEENT